MAWNPSYINSGLFDNTPSGNLTVPVDNAREIGNVWTDNNALFANYDCSDHFDEGEYIKWGAASGKNFSSKMIGLLDSHKGDPAHTDVIFAAFTIKNPTGAQFYKQELVVYGTYVSDSTVHVEAPGEPWNYLDYFYCEVSITRIARRVWATPTATPTVTDLQVSTVTTNFFKVIQGNTTLESLYYFLRRALFCCGNAHYQNKYYFMIGFYTELERDYYDYEGGYYNKDDKNAFAGVGLDIDYLEEQFGGTFEPEETDDPNEEPDEPGGGESGEGGGDGDHEGKYDPIPIPPLPELGPCDAGFIYMLRMDTSAIHVFAHDLLNPTWWAAIKAFFADPMDFICGVMLVPFTPDSQMNVIPKFGNTQMDSSYALVSNQYKIISCGSLYISKYYDSCFDQNPYTSLKIWLPYLGYRDLDVDEVIGKDLYVEYHCDCLTGDCVVFLSSRGSYNGRQVTRVFAQYNGNCGIRVPFGSTSYDAAVAASIQLLGGAVGMVAGGIAAPAGLAAGTLEAGQIASTVAGASMMTAAANKVSTERSGTAGASAGYMSIQYPYILKTVPRQSRPANYRELEGYPSNIAGPLTKFSGYVAIESINLNGIQATREELSEIESLLKQGVYI